MIATFEHIWEEFHPVVESIAARYGAMNAYLAVDHEDFKHEAICWMLKKERHLSDKLAEIGADEFEKYLAKCLNHELLEHARLLRFQATGQTKAETYWYSTSELKVLLPSVFDRTKWLEPPQYEDSGSRSKKLPNEGNNWVTTLADVALAFEKLDYEDQLLLLAYHRDGERNKDLAVVHGLSEASMSSKHTAALRRLQDHLGGPKPKKLEERDPWKGRRSISNSHALAQTRNQYEED